MLGVHSNYFEKLLFGDFKESKEFEVEIKDVPKDALKILVDYFYSGCLNLKDYAVPIVADLLELSRRFDLKDLEDAIVEYLCTTEGLRLENVVRILNMAILLELKELEELCWLQTEMGVEGFFDVEIQLSYDDLSKLLKRNPRRVSEVKLFQLVHRTFKANTLLSYEDVLACIDFQAMTPTQLAEIVCPTKVLGSDHLMKLFRQLAIKNPICIPNLDLGTFKDKFEVICKNPEWLFEIGDEYASQEGDCIIIDLGSFFVVNHIQFKLQDGTEYIVQVSQDKTSWKSVIDFSKPLCAASQSLFFAETVARYIKVKVMATYNMLSCHSFKIFYLPEQPEKSLAGYLYPKSNVAVPQKVQVSCANNLYSFLIGEFKSNGIKTPYVECRLEDEKAINIIFNQPYILTSIRFRLWDFDGRKQSFKIATTSDDENYTFIVRSSELLAGWQTVKFSPRVVISFRITGIKSTIGGTLRLAYFETPAMTESIE